MYVPKSDPDSIDDKDVMGVYIGPLEHYLGFGSATFTRSGKASGTVCFMK
jgi:hypothetical protein